jgi:hydroxyacylglutathione hydrolase
MEIIPGIHWIEGMNCNCYLIVEDEQLVLIDTGLPRKAKKIMAYITDNLHRKPKDLKLIILTHSHWDHTGSAQDLRKVTGTKIAAHKIEAEYISGRKHAPRPTGAIGLVFKLLSPFVKVRPFEVDTVLSDGDTIAGLRIIHVPGHTRGSIALYDPARKVLFPGDMLRYRKGTVEGPPEHFSYNMKQVRRSTEKLRSLDFDTMLGGHGGPLKKGAAKKVRKLVV